MSTDLLFEQHSVKEIQDIEKKLRNDIERKKEELRQMVGERYRDLMEAADTITEMKHTAENIASCIKNMESNCAKFEQSNLKSGIMHTVKLKVSQRKRKNENLYFIAALIRILMDSPGKIWSFIENENYLNAFLLYVLARHTHSLLILDPVYRKQGILANFPIINKQWTSTRPFQNILLQKSEEALLADKICAEKIIGPICCMLFLSEASLEHVLDDILENRKVVISNVFCPEKPAKTQVCDLIDVLQNTLEIVYAVFYSEGKDFNTNLLERTINSITDARSSGPVDLIHSGSLTFQYLPEDVTGYRPSLKKKFCNLSIQYLQLVSNTWIASLKESLTEKLTELLNFVPTMKGLALIREAAMAEQQKESHFDFVCQCILGKPFSIWEFFLQESFMRRIKDVINDKISQSISKCIGGMHDIHEGKKAWEDISSYVWMESESDLAPNICWTTHHQRQVCESGTLGMKAYALTPSVQSICQKIDKDLEDLLQDVSHFKPEDKSLQDEQNWMKTEEQDPDIDLESVFMHLTDECQRSFSNLCEQFKKVLTSCEQINENSSVITKLVSTGHLCHGLTQLCPHLRQCLQLSKVFQQSIQQSSGFTHSAKQQQDEQLWQDLKATLFDLSCLSFRIWSKHKIRELVEKLDSELTACSATGILQSLLQWDSIEIQEESEEGETVKSVLKLPQQVSVPLYNCLFVFCWELNQIGCFSLNSQVRCEMQEECLQELLMIYQKKVHQQWPEDIFTPHLAQTQALQYLFDVQFLLGLMGSGSKDASHSPSLSKEVISEIVRYIDPFDMDVFAPHIQANLKKAIQRSLLLLGLTTSPEQTSHFHGMKSISPSGVMEHNLMLMPSAIPRLPLLPFSAKPTLLGSLNDSAKNARSLSQVALPLKTSPSHSSSPNLSASDNLTSMLKQSSSFYDRVTTAMSSSWFGGT